jgi:peptidoglycan/xylan/chitin deacetylase (PgdA/CDA1 family)
VAGPVVDILMYHSISEGEGPTTIAPSVFREQMEAIAASGVPVITMDDFLDARDGKASLAPASVVITFDDGFVDFASVAWPVLSHHGFRPIVYLPTGFAGRTGGWRGMAEPRRAVMGWDLVSALGAEGVLFGSHTVSHADLASLDPGALRDELTLSRTELELRTGRPVRHFAPPYGRLTATGMRAAMEVYRTSVGTRLGRVTPASDLSDLPRLEMFYFRDPKVWRRHLEGRGGTYLALRRALRTVRSGVRAPWSGV